jgi:Dihaem cytochrome c
MLDLMPDLLKTWLNAKTRFALVRRSQRSGSHSSWVFLLFTLLWSMVLGLGLAQAIEPSTTADVGGGETIGTVDPVPPRYQLGQTVYLENCSTCHIAIPPAVFPDETWRQLLQDSEHYGQQITPLVDPARLLVWSYLRSYSRPLAEDEPVPYQFNDSRYFKALHPRVTLPRSAGITSCISCHSRAEQYDFRSLTAEWQNAP